MSLTPEPNNYDRMRLDRAAMRRTDRAWIESLERSKEARFVPVWRGKNLIRNGAGTPEPAYLQAEHPVIADVGERIFLGLEEKGPVFAVDLSHIDDPVRDGEVQFDDLRSVAAMFDQHDASLLAYAKGITHWHGRHRFCGVCGSPTVSDEAGHVRRCTHGDCAAPQFPRTDPAVIMLIHDGGDRVVLGRQSAWREGMHSVLAGFLEPGESLENAVRREVMEEVGLEIDDIVYNSSQPWPFPSSLMVGFTARATSDRLNVNTDELETARWFTRKELLDLDGSSPLRLSSKDSISRRLLEEWLGRR